MDSPLSIVKHLLHACLSGVAGAEPSPFCIHKGVYEVTVGVSWVLRRGLASLLEPATTPCLTSHLATASQHVSHWTSYSYHVSILIGEVSTRIIISWNFF